ncbi:hypothetical protein [Streptomyces sp. CB03234]|uniref:hypothetical protein n=1 Tax=Streptomyces sp. (strain CB03234) TaxID=1703937 RepID=UPI00117C850A|nr:hypothetical protein [Streptomyces sp. CB03234]
MTTMEHGGRRTGQGVSVAGHRLDHEVGEVVPAASGGDRRFLAGGRADPVLAQGAGRLRFVLGVFRAGRPSLSRT